MLSKSALAGGGQNRCSPLEAFLGLNEGIFSGRFFELTDWGRKCIGGIFGAENAIGGGKNCPQSFELTDPGQLSEQAYLIIGAGRPAKTRIGSPL